MTKSKDLINESIVSFFFLGRAPVAPGTFGSFGSLVLAYFVVQNIEAYAISLTEYRINFLLYWIASGTMVRKKIWERSWYLCTG